MSINNDRFFAYNKKAVVEKLWHKAMVEFSSAKDGGFFFEKMFLTVFACSGFVSVARIFTTVCCIEYI